jgi:hypothetical protein
MDDRLTAVQLKLELQKRAYIQGFLRLDEDSTPRHIRAKLFDELVDSRAFVFDLERHRGSSVFAHLRHSSPNLCND